MSTRKINPAIFLICPVEIFPSNLRKKASQTEKAIIITSNIKKNIFLYLGEMEIILSKIFELNLSHISPLALLIPDKWAILPIVLQFFL